MADIEVTNWFGDLVGNIRQPILDDNEDREAFLELINHHGEPL